ncbi:MULTISPECIES: methionine ABC transporter permease [Priestia]|jgi:D-methionine transport system permease protein|uniref:Putative methionine import ABC transporter, permease protein Met n=1 Tax=Priestia megaterium (strain DSM 319 / IMG 1521) TaxID=592022 RepID=D5DC50_PRIM3|nr:MULTISPECIES: methionine ABC transporter permease [Priestia]RFB30430.1 ABC transporter permease [Bacillus sp. ALD]RFB40169.1 ABC transporter permease [Bacillus sp. RC]ADF38438.1 putative methionine import ABC transporter, permease protein Met [Priestia megaterium DSM 319]ANF45565.1 metal ABC transporter permease [Priestia megaterium]AQU73235.1 metal ABC transporter permease [Priestia megaterium]
MAAFFNEWGSVIWEGLLQTATMTIISLIIAIIIGLPMGIFLVMTRPGGQAENVWVYRTCNWIINIIRSIPFIILLFFILPFTKLVAGTTIGVQGVIVPLVVYTAPYIARLMESALLEVDKGIIEAYQSMGISTPKIIWYVVVREARSGIILGLTIATIGLIGATAMAGLVGAGGLGDIAFQYGHLRFEPTVMYTTILILIVIVQLIQSLGNYSARKLKKDS